MDYMKKFFIVLTVFVLVGALGYSQTVDDIINKYAEAMGGKAKMENVKTMKSVLKMKTPQGEMPMTFYSKKPKNFRMELSVMGQNIVTAFDGKTGWAINPLQGNTDPRELKENELQQADMAWDMLTDPYIYYKKLGHKVELIGTEEVEGSEVYNIKLTRKNNKVSHIYLDAENYIPIKTAVFQKIPNGGEMKVEMILGDYKPVEGVLYPFSMETTIMGNTISMSYESIEVNVEMKDDLFKMPAKKEKKEEEKKEKKK
jgi:outer membrane lipoprotein-sorting protein